MSTSPLQLVGLVLGCIPGINIFAGIIKFFVYLHKESKLEGKIRDRKVVEQTAAKTDQVAKNIVDNNIKKVTEKLKWSALLQAIPFVGIYGAYLEKEALEKISILKKTHLKQIPQIPPPIIASQVVGPQSEDLKPISIKVAGLHLTLNKDLTLVREKKQEISKEINRKGFNDFLLSHHQLTSENKVLIQNTLCKAKQLPNDINYFNVKASNDQLMQIRNLSLTENPLNKPNFRVEKAWFQYDEADHFYIDFAHSTSLGGAYRSYGCVQEERMFVEFASLAILDFITQNGVHPCVDKDGVSHNTYPPEALPTPFIVERIKRDFDITKVPYANDFKKANVATITQGIAEAMEAVPVNIIGLAAVDWRGVNTEDRKYNLSQLLYHFDAALLGNKGAQALVKGKIERATIHTAPWGCGAFLNSEKMLTAIQYLAAKTADVEIVFHGIGSSMNPLYNEKMIKEIVNDIEQALLQKQTPQEILESLLTRQDLDLTWAPKK
jgi:hypothetical protein